MRTSLLIFICALLLAGCTGRQIYDSATGWRQNECQKILESAERARCMENANRDYDSYKKAQDK